MGISFSYALWCVSFNLTVFMIARIVSGLAKANVAITLAIVSDTTTEQQRNRAMVTTLLRSCLPNARSISQAWIGAAFSLGFIFGPLLGALCSQFGAAYWPSSSVSFFTFPAGVSLLLSLINIAFIYRSCPETLPVSKRVRIAKRSRHHRFALSGRMTRKRNSPTFTTPYVRGVYSDSPRSIERKPIEVRQHPVHRAFTNFMPSDALILRPLALASFFYMIVFAGLEFTITFLVYNRFSWNR